MSDDTHDDARDVAVAGAAMVAERLRAAIAERGSATIALSGGDTPGPLYERLAEAHRDDVDWSRVTVVYGDDRCVPPDHELSNHRMAESPTDFGGSAFSPSLRRDFC